MTEARARAEVRKWADRFGLQAWHIDVVCHDDDGFEFDDAPGKSYMGSVSYPNNGRHAVINLALKRPHALVQRVIREEVLHVVLHPLHDHTFALAGLLGSQIEKVADVVTGDLEHEAIAHLLCALEQWEACV